MFCNLTPFLAFAICCLGFARLSAGVTLSQGACQPRTSEDGQSQYCTTSKTSVHRPRGTYLLDTFLLDRELLKWAEGGNLPSWSKKLQAFLLQTYP